MFWTFLALLLCLVYPSPQFSLWIPITLNLLRPHLLFQHSHKLPKNSFVLAGTILKFPEFKALACANSGNIVESLLIPNKGGLIPNREGCCILYLPYNLPFIEHFLKVIIFWVSVPVWMEQQQFDYEKSLWSTMCMCQHLHLFWVRKCASKFNFSC